MFIKVFSNNFRIIIKKEQLQEKQEKNLQNGSPNYEESVKENEKLKKGLRTLFPLYQVFF